VISGVIAAPFCGCLLARVLVASQEVGVYPPLHLHPSCLQSVGICRGQGQPAPASEPASERTPLLCGWLAPVGEQQKPLAFPPCAAARKKRKHASSSSSHQSQRRGADCRRGGTILALLIRPARAGERASECATSSEGASHTRAHLLIIKPSSLLPAHPPHYAGEGRGPRDEWTSGSSRGKGDSPIRRRGGKMG